MVIMIKPFNLYLSLLSSAIFFLAFPPPFELFCGFPNIGNILPFFFDFPTKQLHVSQRKNKENNKNYQRKYIYITK